MSVLSTQFLSLYNQKLPQLAWKEPVPILSEKQFEH